MDKLEKACELLALHEHPKNIGGRKFELAEDYEKTKQAWRAWLEKECNLPHTELPEEYKNLVEIKRNGRYVTYAKGITIKKILEREHRRGVDVKINGELVKDHSYVLKNKDVMTFPWWDLDSYKEN